MICMVDGKHLDTYEASGTNLLWPAWETLRLSNFRADESGSFTYAMVMCTLEGSSPQYPNGGKTCCPRSLRSETVERARERFGVNFLCGFEIEFIIIWRTANGRVEPVEMNAGFFAAAACLTTIFSYMEESVRELEAMVIKVHQFHTEGFHGQYEISTSSLPPLDAVDAYVATCDAIKNVCARHSLLASMHPRFWTRTRPRRRISTSR